MIKIIDENFELFKEFKSYCEKDSFGTRIYSHYLCYGYEFDFVDFWVQIKSENEISAAFCKIDGDFILCLDEKSDFEEISAFLSFQQKLSVTFSIKYRELISIDISSIFVGDILMYKENGEKLPEYSVITPEIKEYYNLLLSCKSNDFFVPEYMTFLSDVSRRCQRNLCDIYGIKKDGELLSAAMTVSFTDTSVILGAVATHKNHRKHGYAGFIVKSLAQKHCDKNSIYIYTTIQRNTLFYMGLGFVVNDKWIKYTYGG